MGFVGLLEHIGCVGEIGLLGNRVGANFVGLKEGALETTPVVRAVRLINTRVDVIGGCVGTELLGPVGCKVVLPLDGTDVG